MDIVYTKRRGGTRSLYKNNADGCLSEKTLIRNKSNRPKVSQNGQINHNEMAKTLVKTHNSGVVRAKLVSVMINVIACFSEIRKKQLTL